VVQRSTGKVIGGNGRMAVMRSLGWTECDVVELDLDDTHATALGIALNRTGELAEWDLPALTKILESFKGTDTFDALGFDEKELNAMLDGVVATGPSLDGIVEDRAPAVPDAATTRAGDLWVLGELRLLCGDSSKSDDVQRLLAGALSENAALPIGRVTREELALLVTTAPESDDDSNTDESDAARKARAVSTSAATRRTRGRSRSTARARAFAS
jgi:ParB-like chromosome segregation protein Spo0J